MTGVKINNDVISMKDAKPVAPAKDANGNASIDRCGAGNGVSAWRGLARRALHQPWPSSASSTITPRMDNATVRLTARPSAPRAARQRAPGETMPDADRP